MYALVDCNNFYVSCERAFQPHLQGKPVVVLSNNDGCIISRSEEAKELGIDMASPEFKLRPMLKEKGVHVFSSNYSLYGDLSARVMDILKTFCPNVEIYSIDEAFLDFEGMEIVDYQDYGLKIREKILRCLSIPICVGIAPTKVLSKIANRIAKKFYTRTGGSYVIDTEEKRIKAIKWLKIEDVWGIGHRLAKKLKAQNVHTAYDYTLPHMEAWIKKEMGVVGMRIRHELLGEPVLGPNPIPEIRKNISTTRSFPKMLSDFDLIRERVSTFATVTAEKLRKQGSLCHTIIVMLTADKFSQDKVKYHYSKARTLPYPTNSALIMSKVAIELVKELMDSTDTVVFKKTGVIASELVPADAKQFNMFVDEDPRHLALMNAMDKINNKMGDRKIRLGAQAIKTWDMRQDMLSPRFTTNFNEILVAKCN